MQGSKLAAVEKSNCSLGLAHLAGTLRGHEQVRVLVVEVPPVQGRPDLLLVGPGAAAAGQEEAPLRVHPKGPRGCARPGHPAGQPRRQGPAVADRIEAVAVLGGARGRVADEGSLAWINEELNLCCNLSFLLSLFRSLRRSLSPLSYSFYFTPSTFISLSIFSLSLSLPLYLPFFYFTLLRYSPPSTAPPTGAPWVLLALRALGCLKHFGTGSLSGSREMSSS